MNIYRKAAIFITFFGSCLAVGLVVSSLGTKRWIVARAHIKNSVRSNGTIHLGLFEGEKSLDYGVGWRNPNIIHVTELVNNDKDFLLYGIWISTIGCLCVGLLFSVLSALFAVINTATNQYLLLTGLPGLYLWNALACAMHLTAVVLWAVQFQQKLQYNVMTKKEVDARWTSENMAHLGYSYWFVLGAVVVHICNILTIFVGTREPRVVKTVDPVVEEKTGGAIMLY